MTHTLLAVSATAAVLLGVTACGSGDDPPGGRASSSKPSASSSASARPSASATPTPTATATATATPTPTAAPPAGDGGQGAPPAGAEAAPDGQAAVPAPAPAVVRSAFCTAVADLGGLDQAPPSEATPAEIRDLASKFSAVAAVAPAGETQEAWAGYASVFTLAADAKEGKTTTTEFLVAMKDLPDWQAEMAESMSSCDL